MITDPELIIIPVLDELFAFQQAKLI